MVFLLKLAWLDLRNSGRSLWIFCACLVLGVALVAATGGLYRIVHSGMLADTRALLGGDVEVDANAVLSDETLQWMRAQGTVTLVRELYTMLGNADGEFIRVELQSMDANYPLYGELELQPAMSLAAATGFVSDTWGIAVDQSLAERHSIAVGDSVFIGDLMMTVRALVISQPDRNLTAEWRGAPVLVADESIEAAGLTGPDARIDYDYKVATSVSADQWREQFYQRFSDQGLEVRTFEDRSQRIAERLGQIASGLMIIAFSTLFIGGLGVFSSVRTHLQGKRKTIATLRAVGLRNARLAAVYLLQIAMLGAGASVVGCLIGGLLAWVGGAAVASELPTAATPSGLLFPLIVAFIFGCLTAFVFALPSIGRALAVSPAMLFRDNTHSDARQSFGFTMAIVFVAVLLLICLFVSLPDPVFALGFMVVVLLLLGALEVLLVMSRKLALYVDRWAFTRGNFALRLALANLHRVGSPLRSAMLSLGSALTVLVACTLVVVSLLRTVYATIPQSAPALVLYDIEAHQVEEVTAAVVASGVDASIETVPLVRARIEAIGESSAAELFTRGDNQFRRALNNEHKLSYRGGNIDGLALIDGAWWEPGTEAVMSLEDREADRLGVAVGQRIQYLIGGRSLTLEVRAIHTQKGVQTRFWFEGIVADGLLEGVSHRRVGTAYMTDEEAVNAQKNIAGIAPSVITVRTERLLTTARDLLGRATSGLLVIAGVSLMASLLVLVSVIAAGRSRQIYDASVLNALGARLSLIQQSLRLEFVLLAVVTCVFAVVLGAVIALPLLEWRMKLPSTDLLWVAVVVAFSVAAFALGLGARYVRRRLALTPAVLLRESGG